MVLSIVKQKVRKQTGKQTPQQNQEKELHREKAVRPNGKENVIAVDDGFKNCETEGRKMENKDQGGIKRNNEKPLRIKKMG